MIYDIKDIFREIKYAYQRVRFGYDETISWALDDYFHFFVKPIKEFCERNLTEPAMKKNNSERYKIFTKTLKLIKNYEKKNMSITEEHKATVALWAYIGANIGIYWD